MVTNSMSDVDDKLTTTNYYSRQTALDGFGLLAQQKLGKSKVVVVGAGGLGCPALHYLVGAGVGYIRVVDGDVVSVSNLHRQVLFGIDDIGQNKAEVASKRLQKQNPFIHLECMPYFLTSENMALFVDNMDVVIDATDNFVSRFLLGDYTAKRSIPLVYSAIYGFEGQLSVFNYNGGVCLRDLHPTMPNREVLPNCSVNGAIGVVPGLFGVLQALECIKVIAQIGSILSGKLLVMDLLTLEKHEFTITKKSRTNVNNNKVVEAEIREISAATLKSHLADENTNFMVVDVREPYEHDYFNIGGLHIPMQQIPERLNELPLNKDLVFVCKAGVRSYNVANYVAKVYPKARIYNLTGGLMAW